ncbi:MAG: response regulator [Kofleriaceae bacterium]|nr:response regulator [Kofleriaceae bacterium]
MSARLLIVDDSPLIRSVLRTVLAGPEITVVGEAADGLQAQALVKQLAPDVVTMDVVMPMMSGLETIERIMSERPTPIVVVADVHGDTEKLAMEALDRGAVALFPKPTGGFDAHSRDELTRAITRAARITVRPPARTRQHRRLPTAPAFRAHVDVVGIVGSTGSPRTLRAILSALPSPLPYGIAIVQHTTRGFTQALASWLDESSRLDVRVARDGSRIEPGQIVVAPDDAHLEIAHGGKIRIRGDGPVDGHRPSGTVLLRSLAQTYGPRASGVVLSGMGRDGAEGAGALERAGAMVFVEDPDSAVVGGMPREALKAAPSAVVVPASQLGDALARFGRAGGA